MTQDQINALNALTAAIGNFRSMIDAQIANKLEATDLATIEQDVSDIKALIASDDAALDQLQEIVDFIKLNKDTLDALAVENIAGLQDVLDGKVSNTDLAAEIQSLADAGTISMGSEAALFKSVTVAGSDVAAIGYAMNYNVSAESALVDVTVDKFVYSIDGGTETEIVAVSGSASFDLTLSGNENDVKQLNVYAVDSLGNKSSGVNKELTLINAAIEKPSILSPANTETGVSQSANVTSSDFATIGSSDTHASTDWEVASDANFNTIVFSSYSDSSNLTSIAMSGLEMNTTYYVRVRHNGSALGASEYSDVVSFTTLDAVLPQEVFSTTLYTGNGSTQEINNGIDLAGEGGLVWRKGRGHTDSHSLSDTERGVGTSLMSNGTSGELVSQNYISSFTSDGFVSEPAWNQAGNTYASWTFRKAPKFFDVVTWTGNNIQGRSISHNLGSVPGVIITKKLNASENWVVYHRSNGSGKMLYLNGTNATLNSAAVYPTTPTDSVFYVGNDSAVNGTSSDTYVAYLFAHDDSENSVIKCGSYTSTGNVDLGWTPQFIIAKSVDNTGDYSGDWRIVDTERGINSGDDNILFANSSRSENTDMYGTMVELTDNGFNVESQGMFGSKVIYMAIRAPII